MDERLIQALRLLPDRLAWHVLLSGSALILACVIALPLAVAAYRCRKLRGPLLGGASLVQTIPSLALLAMFFPLLLGLSNLTERAFGVSFSALGFLPALLALTLYAMLPLLRNGVTALDGVDPAALEAARGVGMTPRQILRLVELPLAAPVIMAGLRTASVWTIGAATLATPIGQTTLGDYIFSGLQTENWIDVMVGVAAAAGLALVVDRLLAMIERGLAVPGGLGRRAVQLGVAGLAVLAMAAVVPLFMPVAGSRYVIGAKNFSEQYILAEVLAQRLERANAQVSRRLNLGSTVAYRALAEGEIDVYVDYSGTLWANVLGRTDNPGREEMLKELAEALKTRDGVTLLGPLGFENAYALAMKRDDASRLGIRSMIDLTLVAPSLRFGTDLEFTARPEWASLQNSYGLNFGQITQYQPTFMYRGLQGGDVDVITAFSSDGRIAADNLVVLSDPRGALPPYDAVVLISPQRAGDSRLIGALRPFIGRIDADAMRRANLAVDRDEDKQSPAEAARGLTSAVGLSR
jgi:osmoprotectant transport system permease protein